MSTDAEKTVQCIEETLLAYCRQQGLFKSGDRVIAAYSGGADSMALLLFLLRRRKDLVRRPGLTPTLSRRSAAGTG